ncbi:Lipid A export ATP-binding/permease protein MsbA [Sedimentisphaera cyanobacteriorum]|uniref:Lipid A export ATP-binding/permease protein MsbA n=1 Tax=Sedimentisphaera cyanobacteriorum TaxID=1940790 RepID=A0A1Q2HNU4_9BACT|nr:ABC transporter ATP-binding protein [Sedimentisphaera cyanobacteriorum]AQQ08915.1 Lipid A export ATP-binding/permease protein MsbA [Sedimentisphaera cyanobacteriorum]
MNYFKRLLKYIWPQWPRIIVILVCVFVIALTFSASFLTVIPLLKVMMGQEGLHGWAHRNICSYRYGIDFYVPDNTELSDPENAYSTFLLLTKAEEDKLGYKSGLRANDRIVYVSKEQIGENPGSMAASEMLDKLANLGADKRLYIKYLSYEDSGEESEHTTEIKANAPAFYLGASQGLLSMVSQTDSRNSKSEAMRVVMLVVAGMTVLRCVSRFFQGYLSQKVVNIGLADLRDDVFSHIVEMPIGYFSLKGSSDTVSKFLQDSQMAGNGIKTVFEKAIREPAKGLMCLAMAFMLSWQIVLVFLCGIPFLGFAINKLGRRIKKATKKSLVSWGQMLSKLDESVNGLRAVKVYNQQDREKQSFRGVNQRLLKEQNKIAKVNALTSPLMEVLGLFAGIIGFLMALEWVLAGNMDETEFFAMLMLLGTSAESFRKASNVWNKLQQANAACERIFSLVDTDKERDTSRPAVPAKIENEITFKNISFRYPGAKNDALKNVNLTVKKGENIAVVGSNGSGKTTLLNLLPRFYDPTEGEILLDGVNIQDMSLKNLREKIAVVSQKVITFHDTVAQNIAYGRPSANREEIIQAAKLAYADEFIKSMTEGYDTIIGENGAGLSGGQLQRIVIARAVLKDPEILIFDEAMSQVDADSEAKINQALEQLTTERTSFVIAHRFSTVINSDVIAVIDQGRIVDTGRHSELIERCQTYKNLYETQLLQ